LSRASPQALRVRTAAVIEVLELNRIVLPAALLTDLVGAGGRFCEAEELRSRDRGGWDDENRLERSPMTCLEDA